MCQMVTVQSGDTVTILAQKYKVGNWGRQLVQPSNADARSGVWGGPAHRGRSRGASEGVAGLRCRGSCARRPRPMPPPVHTSLPLVPVQVDVAETLALNNLTADAVLPLNFKLKLPKWNESCPPEGVPAVLPSDTVQ